MSSRETAVYLLAVDMNSASPWPAAQTDRVQVDIFNLCYMFYQQVNGIDTLHIFICFNLGLFSAAV